MPIPREYRPVIRAQSAGYSAAALVGIHSASIGWSFEDQALRDGLHGFAIRRSDFNPESGELLRVDWLEGQKRFEADADQVSFDVRSFDAPFQRFRWNDYTLDPAMAYRFDIFPMRGVPGALTRNEDPIELWIRPSPIEEDGTSIFVNRGVTAAFAYMDRFKLQHPRDVPNGAAYRWLSRGLKESLFDFIDGVDAGEDLHVCIYEFFDAEIADALAAARDRGVNVDIVYHALPGNHATEKNEQALAAAGLEGSATPRAAVANISHNKFMVHLRDGEALRVHTGTANFSENAFHYQTNAAVVFADTFVATCYEDYFQLLKTDPQRSRSRRDPHEVRAQVRALMDRIANDNARVFENTYFSPLRGLDIVDAAVSLVENARSAVFVSSPFGLDKRIIEALGNNSEEILEYGLANTTARKRINGLNRRNTRFFTPTRLETYMGRAWDSKAFGAHKIHTKMIAVDPWSDAPKLLFGLANFSEGSCTNNDENAFLVSHDPRLSAVLVTEFLRMFDHYKSRFFINQMRSAGNDALRFLSDDGSWMNTAFRPDARSHKFRDRLVFSGG